MQRHNSEKDANLIERLVLSPYKFSFTKCVDTILKFQNVENYDFGNKKIFFRSFINFQSKYTDIKSIKYLKDGIIEIYINFMGISGIEGNLPDVYLEKYILYPDIDTKNAMKSFLDIMNHKMISLWYLISKKYIPSCYSCKVQDSLIGEIISNLSGIDDEMISEYLIPDQFKISCQDLFWRKTRSADGLKILLESFFDVDVTIEQFVGAFTEPQRELQTKIGINHSRYNALGEESFLGSKVWNQANGINIHLNNLTLKRYKDFVPKISKFDKKFSSFEKMKKIVRDYVSYDFYISVFFHISQETVVKLPLNGINRLGIDSFISSKKNKENVYCTNL